MFRLNISILLLFILSVCSTKSYAQTPVLLSNLPKCELKDQECFRKLNEQFLKGIAEKGLPDLDIPPVDPIQLKNVTVSLLDLLDITLVKGFATGIRNCVFDKFMFNLTTESGYQENTCSIKIEGKYKLSSHSPVADKFFGRDSVHGEGYGKVSLDDLQLKFNFPVYAQKRSDGEIYMNCDYKRVVYDYQVRGGAKFSADNIYVGGVEISKEFVQFLNENRKFVMATFGKAFIDKAMEFYFDLGGKFLNVVPAKYEGGLKSSRPGH